MDVNTGYYRMYNIGTDEQSSRGQNYQIGLRLTNIGKTTKYQMNGTYLHKLIIRGYFVYVTLRSIWSVWYSEVSFPGLYYCGVLGSWTFFGLLGRLTCFVWGSTVTTQLGCYTNKSISSECAGWKLNPHTQYCILFLILGKTSRPVPRYWPRGFT